MTTPPLAGSTFLGRCLLLAGLGAVLVAGTWAPPPAAAQGTPIGFPEDFALAADRAAVLKQLVPGSEDYYFYQCLLKQHVGAFDEVKPLLETWIQRHGRTPRVLEIENRQALLLVDRDPAATYALLRERLGLRFDAQRQARGEKPDLPTALDPELIAPRNLLRRALAQHRGSLDGLRDSALESMAGASLTDDLLMSLLGRLRRPDLPNLPALIARNLDHPRSRGFGSLPIHRNLLLEQLEELVQLRPKLLAESALIEVWLPRLKPSADLRWSRDLEAREAYLDRLWIFAQRLPPAHNSLKAHVLYARLAHDLEAGKPSPERFLAYLRLPRPGTYVNPDHIRRTRAGTEVVDANRDFPTELGRIGNDEPLVRAYLQHFFQSEDAYAPYAEFVREDYLRRLFAETKILLGTGDMERWYSLLDDPAYYEQLKERVEILFAPTQRRHFAAEEPVAIDVDVKNVETLLVKVFVIDTFDFHREKKAEVDARIDLDGMIANEEKTYTYGESPFRRVRRHFDFPSLREPGTYVVEFLGNGLSSRAVIEKGRLQYTERVGVAGHVFRVLDEAGQHRRAASIWFDGRSFAADDRGEINVPFGAKNETRDLVLHHGRLSTRARFEHRAETYQLDAGIVVDREALLAGGKARILVRPSLRVAGVPASLALLKEPELTITAVDLEGVASNLVVRDLALAADRDLVHEIRVPENLVELTAALRGKVESLSEGKTIPLESPTASFALSRIDATAETACPLLGRTAEGYVLDLLGKNGEPKPDRAVQLQLQHRDFTDVVHVTLKTDARGRIRLGPLPGIVSLRTSGFPAEIGAFTLEAPPRAWPESLHGAVGTTLHVPYPGRAGAPARSDLSLLEVRGDTFARDAFSHLAVAEGFVELRELPAGDYDLWLKGPDRHIAVRVAAGASRDGWVIGRDRLLELAARAPLHIVNLSTAENHLEVQLANATPHTRVHLFATRYLEPYDPLTGIAVAPGPEARWALVDHAESSYHAGREIGDEYRYILDRRYARKYPGNMLRRPGLLLNPWALDETATALGLDGGAGGAFGGRRGGVGRRYGGEGGVARAATSTAPGIFPNLDFLPEAAPTLANLRPDAAGRVRVPLADLGPGQLVHVLAVDRQDSTYASLPMAERPFTPRDRSLTAGLDPDRHFAEQRRIEFVRAGTAAVIDDVTTARTEIYDSLAGVFRLLQTLSGNSDLKTFAFLLRWPELAAAERRELYSRHACHELHFFLYQKDRPFFDEVVRPYLASKAHKTFLDQWLLGADLGAYLEPWKFARLNVVERILLARRLAGEAESGARHVRELLEMVRPDPERAAFRFATALRSGALDASRAPRLAEAEKKLKSEDRDAPESARPAGAPAPSRLARLKDARKAEAPADKMADEPAADAAPAAEREEAEEVMSKDLERREQQRQLYRAPDRTRAWVESNYWHRRIEETGADLIAVNAFWRDYAAAREGDVFCSPHVAEATSSLAEMILALAVLDLPFEPGAHAEERQGDRLTLRAASPLLLVRREITATAPAGAQSPILIGQNFFRLDDRYRYEGNERLDNFVTDEFVAGVGYGCQVVLTNPTSTPRKLDVLLQIPRGALPLQSGVRTRGAPVQLEPFATAALEYAFYFPAAGKRPHYPAHVAKDGELVAFAPAVTMTVVETPSKVDTASWEHVSQDGSAEEVLAFLDTHNLLRLDLGKIAWRLRDRGFFAAVVERLRRRHVYSDAVWSWGILHQDAAATADYLPHAAGFVASAGRALVSPLLTIDPVARHAWQIVEYEPLFHSRAHRFGKRREILNHALARQYLALLDILAYRPKLDDADWMTVTYYLLLQDRVEEAMASFARVDPNRLPMRLQYDYMTCYLAFFTDEPTSARAIAAGYRDHPVERWRTMFRDVLRQLDEAEGKAAAGGDLRDRERRHAALAATEPGLELAVEARRVTVRYQNLRQCEVSYYRLDVEFSFSTHPFVQQGAGGSAFIEPARSDRVDLPADRKEVTFDLPAEFQGANVLVEVRGAGVTRRHTYLASSLAVQLVESYGQLQVTHADSGKPLPKVYVKVYARLPGGKVRFHKDGYTDLRGRFDYASVSDAGTAGADRYAILVLSETHGAVIREAVPPGK